jgi:hypothetical protein
MLHSLVSLRNWNLAIQVFPSANISKLKRVPVMFLIDL